MSPGGIPGHFDITQFFSGVTQAHGLFEDRFGRVRRRFTVTIHGRWQAQEFVLREDFIYDDGETEVREWRIRPGDGGRFTATCADCVGIAQGESDTHSWRMTYDFRLKTKKRAITLSFDDRVDRVAGGMALNRATVRKWGVKVGEVVIVFTKPDARRTDAREALNQAAA